MWTVVLGVMAGLTGLIVLLLFIPFDLTFRLDVTGRPVYSLRWQWLFGLVSREIRKREGSRSGKQPVGPGFHLRRLVSSLRAIAEYSRIEGLAGQVWRLIKESLKTLKIKRLKAEFQFGLEDPADTFYLFMVLEPLNQILQNYRPGRVNIHASFEQAICEGYLDAVVRFYPGSMIFPVCRFLFSAAVFRFIKKWITLKWKENTSHWKVRLQSAL